jgi:hypothetical protein
MIQEQIRETLTSGRNPDVGELVWGEEFRE